MNIWLYNLCIIITFYLIIFNDMCVFYYIYIYERERENHQLNVEKHEDGIFWIFV